MSRRGRRRTGPPWIGRDGAASPGKHARLGQATAGQAPERSTDGQLRPPDSRAAPGEARRLICPALKNINPTLHLGQRRAAGGATVIVPKLVGEDDNVAAA